jgi:hypothetical protein
MGFACWITKAPDKHSDYEILTASPRQQWLRERASTLRLYAHYLSCLMLNAVVHKLPLVFKSLMANSSEDMWKENHQAG